MTRISKAYSPLFRGLHFAEYVSSGHPDKVADIIADAVLDAALAVNREARVGIEVAIKDHDVWIFGEISGADDLDLEEIVHEVLRDVGYGDERWGLNLNTIRVRSTITPQSADIANGLKRYGRLGAGDQAIVYGFASDEHCALPIPLTYARRIIRAHSALRARRPELGPDAKVLVGIEYALGAPRKLASITFSSQHDPDLPISRLRDILYEEILLPEFGDYLPNTEVILNPAGPFVVGGPVADAGLTGRKLAVDTYGGLARHGGGALSGKDGSKVDRFGAYVAREFALHFLREWEARVAEVRIAYAIGRPTPLSVQIATDTANDFDWRPSPHGADELLEALTPEYVINALDLKSPNFRKLAKDGHFGRDDVPWEANRVMREKRTQENQAHAATCESSSVAAAADPQSTIH